MNDRDSSTPAEDGPHANRRDTAPPRAHPAERSPGLRGANVADTREPSPAAVETFENVPIGDYLRRQRVLRDVSIEELATITRIPLRSLERLERGEFDGETDGFVRGFVRTVSVALGLDVEDTVARMLEEPATARWERHAPGRRTKQLAAAFVGLVLIGIVALFARAGWHVLAGSDDGDPERALVVWRDPVHALAEATGAEVDPALEIDPARGSRSEAAGRASLGLRGYAPEVAARSPSAAPER